jgi:tRNA(adenine34) deaminase
MKINHSKYMNIALTEAEKAGQKAEVPIGAVLVSEDGDILSATHNQTISLHDPTAHAEILALRQAAEKTQNYRLLNTTLYVTIEPCVMCMGAIVHARISALSDAGVFPQQKMKNSHHRDHRVHRVRFYLSDRKIPIGQKPK